jgi:anti-sigma factor RsiW
MNCAKFENSLALYVEGDLSDRQIRRVEDHLRACHACREYLESLKASQAEVKSLGSEQLDATVFESVRARVLQQIITPRVRPGYRVRQYAFAGALLVFLVVVGLFRRPGTKLDTGKMTVSSERQATTSVAHLPAGLDSASVQPSLRERQVRHRRRNSLTSQIVGINQRPRESFMIKLVTDDPNIVVYWYFD